MYPRTLSMFAHLFVLCTTSLVAASTSSPNKDRPSLAISGSEVVTAASAPSPSTIKTAVSSTTSSGYAAALQRGCPGQEDCQGHSAAPRQRLGFTVLEEGESSRTSAPTEDIPNTNQSRGAKMIRHSSMDTGTVHIETVRQEVHGGDGDGDDDPTNDKQVLHESRMTEDLRRSGDEDDEDVDDDGTFQDAAGSQGEEGRAAVEHRRSKLKKMSGTVLQMIMMIKMMPLMFISTKIAVLSFLVQMKTAVLSLVSVGIAAVQLFWRIQERQQQKSGHIAALPAGWEDQQQQSAWPDRRKYISF